MQNTALNILKTGNNVFITGSAGTGKTYLLNKFTFYLKSRKVIPTIVAPTGIAASHLRGQTIHSYFSLGIRSEIDDDYIDSLLEKKYLQKRFAQLKVLIIDEISMVSPEIFSSIDKILQAFKSNSLAFGGVQTILSGDFFQLPPISRTPSDKRFAWQSPSWKALGLKTCYLEEKFRQDDNVLITILDEIRSGAVSSHSFNVLNSRFHKDLGLDFTPTKLYTHNMDVDRINLEELNKLNTSAFAFNYKSEGSAKNIEKIFKSSLVLEEINLKIGAVVMFIKNNHDLAYINGTTGVIVDFDKETKLPIVKTTDGSLIKTSLEEWTMENESANIVAKVSQVPLKLAWAITIHKSQGMTLDAAEIDLSKTFEVGQGYVALSRIKNIEGLRLMGLNDNALLVDSLILHIDPRIKAASQKASDEISAVSEEKLQEIFDAYVLSVDGLLDIKKITEQEQILNSEKKFLKKSSTPTHIQTKELIESSASVEALAKNRGMSKSTIINHLRILKEEDAELKLEKFLPEASIVSRIGEALVKIKERNNKDDFSEDGKPRLKPIFELLNGEIPYDDIRISLISS
ncbi:AAA family ATPase [Sulfurimonas sp. SAG-AH-194-L11]|nr:helix-turn-helix domain-containing protein [Sulfurimonas sp. SAG-AH-194-L11]MDF1877177.1 AAA family ATPase [Sulfurimonas sp. SAG-AH-194-L11]